MNRRGQMPNMVVRLFDESWQRWDFTSGLPNRIEAESVAGNFRHILAVPARQVISTPLWIDATDTALAPETVKLELEVRGLLPRVQGMSGVALRLLPHANRTLAVVAVFPPELPADFPAAEAFDVSPFLLNLPHDAATLWREGEDFVVAFTRGGDVVYWETIDGSLGAEEVRGWLGLLCLRLRGEAVIEGPPPIVSWIEGLPAARLAPEGCEIIEDAAIVPAQPSLQRSKFDWKPVSAQLTAEKHARRERIKRVVLAVAACYLVIAAVLALYFGSLRWQMSRLVAETKHLHAEVEKFLPIEGDWKLIAPTVSPSIYPLEILGGIVGGMPPKGVRLILFRIEDGRIMVNGEADTFQMATDFYNTLVASKIFQGFNLQSETPQMKANNSASFNIIGTIPPP